MIEARYDGVPGGAGDRLRGFPGYGPDFFHGIGAMGSSLFRTDLYAF